MCVLLHADTPAGAEAAKREFERMKAFYESDGTGQGGEEAAPDVHYT